MSNEKTLYRNGEAVATAPGIYFAIMELREMGHTISTPAIFALANGKKEYTDGHGTWKWE